MEVAGMPFQLDLIESAQMLKAGVDSVSDRTTVGHLPGVGLVVVAEWVGEMDFAKTRRRLEALVVGMAATIEGLGPDELVTVAWLGTPFGGSPRQLVVTVKPNDRGALEVFVDGVRAE
jgi:hypothetical protein